MAVIDDDLPRHHIDLVSDTLEVSAILLEDVCHGRLEAVVCEGTLHLELVVGVAPLRRLVRLKQEIIVLIAFKRALDSTSFRRRLHRGRLAELPVAGELSNGQDSSHSIQESSGS